MRAPRPCRAWRESLRELVDGHASLKSVAAVERHAETCAGCAAELQVARRMRGLLDGAAVAELTRAGEEAFIEGVFSRIDSDRSPTGEAPPLRPRRLAPRRAVQLGAASLVLAAAAALLLVVRSHTARPHGLEERPSVAPRVDLTAAADNAPAETVGARSAADRPGRELVLGDERAPLDLERFTADLRHALDATGFDPYRSSDLQPLLLELDMLDPTDLARGARGVLGTDGPQALRGAAARLLGPRADVRDRALLRDQFSTLGHAAARSLLDGGERGVRVLWSLSAERGERGAIAVDALANASAGGDLDPLDAMPAETDPSIAARVAIASPDRMARELLYRFLATGESPWLDAWATREDAEDALAQTLERRPPRDVERSRLVRATTLRPVEAALPMVMAALVDGDRSAPAALAALLPLGGADALLGATASGRLRSDFEDAAWRAAIGANADLMLEAALREGAAAVLVSATMRAFAAEASEDNPTLLLVRLAARASGDRALSSRVDALLHLAAIGPQSGPPAPVLLDELAPLRLDPSPRLAAAAWMAWRALGGELDQAPAAIDRALRRGGPPTALHARLTRAVGRRSGARPH